MQHPNTQLARRAAAGNTLAKAVVSLGKAPALAELSGRDHPYRLEGSSLRELGLSGGAGRWAL